MPAEQLAALRELRDFLATDPVAEGSPLRGGIGALHHSLDAIVGDGADTEAAHQLASLLLDPLPDQFEWATAHGEIGAVHWAEIVEIGRSEGDVPADAVPTIAVAAAAASRTLVNFIVEPFPAGYSFNCDSRASTYDTLSHP